MSHEINRSIFLKTILLPIVVSVFSSIIALLITENYFIGLLVFVFFLIILFIGYFIIYCKLKRFMDIRKCGILNVFPDQYSGTTSIQSKANTSTQIDILTIRGLGIFALKDSLFRRKIIERKGQISIRVLFLNPESKYVDERAKEIGENAVTFRKAIILAQESIQELKNKYDITIQAAMYDALPIWRLIFCDQYLYVSSFLPSKEGHLSPMYEMTSEKELTLYNTFKREFEYLWGISKKFI